MSDDSLTARNRINQRNFRARRQNYIKELEERIRKYEFEGVQATIEVQNAARQVTDQNIKLRNLLIQKFGMTDPEITTYLGLARQSPPSQSHPFLNAFAPAVTNQPANLSIAPSGGLAPKQQISSEPTHSYPTPPQQHDPPRSLQPFHLDPALSLASLRRFSSTTHDQSSPRVPLSSRQNSDHSSTTDAMDHRSSLYDPNHPGSPTDTLSESSNPTTPADQINAQIQAAAQQQHHQQPIKSTTKKPNDETACEEAARIIASMRGEDNNADQVMLELGCDTPDTQCKVKNLSIFQILDR